MFISTTTLDIREMKTGISMTHQLKDLGKLISIEMET